MIKKTVHLITIGLVIVMAWHCGQDAPVPKPRIYPRIEWPEGEVVDVYPEDCPFTFAFPSYGTTVKQRPALLPGEQLTSDCWFNLQVPAFNAELFFTHKTLGSRDAYDKAVADNYRIISQVNRRSDYTEETVLHNTHGVAGVKYAFQGEAASPVHFYVSDTTRHFVKGALYYRHSVDADSMMPVTKQLMKDIDLLLASIKWLDDQ